MVVHFVDISLDSMFRSLRFHRAVIYFVEVGFRRRPTL